MGVAGLSSEIVPPEGLEAIGRDVGRNVVWMCGEYDISGVDALSEALARAMSLDERELVIDLSEVEFMDASTIGVFVAIAAELQAQVRALVLRSPTDFGRRILELCGLTGVLEPAVA
jgi:anti-anti-sigma factor